ncbi:MAG: hypothetical protein COA96_15850 [SAR86 cluster bacterium]|uniref:Uncharacterized protein n=1 Tax=SAR86 cluster bacterium TaxID=2030880 RepID=A0A2A5ALT0_9GAMM|nr:MAG: hypothetical protein COA96_15850 [SAR86 cluster bacterium]
MNDANDQSKRFLPVWVWIITLIQIFLVLFFSAGTAMSPGDFIPGATELDYVTQLYITRNVTVVLGIVVAILFRSHKTLFAVLIIRMLTDISDVITVYALNVEAVKSSVPMVVVILIIPSLMALGYLWKRIRP